MNPVATTFHSPPAAAPRRTTTESPFVRRLLIGVALVFLSFFLLVPLVFAGAHSIRHRKAAP